MRKRWRIVAVSAVLCGAVIVPFVRGALADSTTPDGGGWANAGSSQTTSKMQANAVAPLAVPSGFTVQGIDVSSNDHRNFDIDWTALAASGVKFAYIKATEGITYTNPYFAGDATHEADYQIAKNSGLYVGAYAFGRPDNPDAAGQADHLIDSSLWTADSQTLVPFLDVEWPYQSIKDKGVSDCWNLTPQQLVAWIHAFVDQVEKRINRKPMIYTNAGWWKTCTADDVTFGNYPLNLAAYTSTPPTPPTGWQAFTIWQFAGGNNSVAGNYDKDVINGDLSTLAALATPKPLQVVNLLAHANGRFVTADSAGAKPLIANRTQLGTWEQFDVVDAGDGYVGLRSHANGRFVTADAGGAKPLIASRMSYGTWERFTLVRNSDGSVSLRSKANGKYVTADGGGTKPLIASRTSIGSWEKFDKVPPTKAISLHAHANGMYVTADGGGTKPLIANRTGVGSWEHFELYELGGGRIALRATVNQRFVTAGATPLIASRTTIGSAETFTLVQNSDGSVSLKAAANGKYVTAGATPLIASGTSIGAAQSFDLG